MTHSLDGILARFTAWLEEAKAHPGIAEPTAMGLATATRGGVPSLRMVLLKAYDARGFGFYTNDESRKGHELHENPHVALCFHWMPLKRQLRIEGRAERLSEPESDAYFATRSRESRLGAWASAQSHPLANREELLHRFEEATAKFEGKEVPRPPYWSGWRVVPERIEFWQQGEFRLHDREVFTRHGEEWKSERLYP